MLASPWIGTSSDDLTFTPIWMEDEGGEVAKEGGDEGRTNGEKDKVEEGGLVSKDTIDVDVDVDVDEDVDDDDDGSLSSEAFGAVYLTILKGVRGIRSSIEPCFLIVPMVGLLLCFESSGTAFEKARIGAGLLCGDTPVVAVVGGGEDDPSFFSVPLRSPAPPASSSSLSSLSSISSFSSPSFPLSSPLLESSLKGSLSFGSESVAPMMTLEAKEEDLTTSRGEEGPE